MEKANSEELSSNIVEKASRILFCTNQLKALLKSNEIVEADLEKKSLELEVKEKELQSLRLDLEKRCQIFDKEKADQNLKEKKLKNLSLDLEKRSQIFDKVKADQNLKEKELQSLSLDLEKRCQIFDKVKADQDLKEKELQNLSLDLEKRSQIFEKEKNEAGNLKSLVEECTEELRSKRNQLTIKLDLLTRTQRGLESKEEQLKNVMAEIKRRCNEARKVDDRKKEVEGKIEKRKNELALILDKIKESGKQFVTVDEQLESKRRQVEIVSSELDVLKNQVESEEKKLIQLKRETKAAESKATSERIRQQVQGKEKELDQLKNQIESAEKKLLQVNRDMEEVTHRKEKILEVIHTKIQESSKQLLAVNEKLESQQKLLETRSVELVSRDMELECVAESSKQFIFDLEAKEKRLQVLKSLMTISSEQLDLKSKELGDVQKLIEEQTKKLSDMQKQQSSATVMNDSSQQNAVEADLFNEDAPLQHESSASLVHSELSIALKASPNPAELVLDLVQEVISKGSALEDSAVEILVRLFDELAKFQEPEQSQLQLRATEVATLWKGKITIKAPKSSLEALAFLMFIVAYGLKKMINQEETFLLASSIAQYRQAPALFNSLGLKSGMIPEIVNELIKRSQYIPAVELICHYKLTKDFSPTDLLMKELTNLRRSILEKRPTGSSQANDKDAGRLSDILELVAHYELKIDLPGDLVQRENLSSLFRCSVTHLTSSSSPQANSPAQQSGVKVRVPKPEVKPYLTNP